MTPSGGTLTVELWMALAGAACIAGPVIAAIWWHRRTGAVYRAFLYGAAVFFLFQIVLRLPWQIPLVARFGSNPAWQLPLLAFSAFTAALFEEGGRYAGYRVLLRDAWTMRVAVMYGLGHGGLEAMLLVGVNLVASAVTLHLVSAGVIVTPRIVTAMHAVAAGYTPVAALAAVVERATAMAMHVGLSLVVLQAMVRSQWRWLALAVAIHFAVDFAAAFMADAVHAPTWVIEAALVAVCLPVLYYGVKVGQRREPDGVRPVPRPASRRSSTPAA